MANIPINAQVKCTDGPCGKSTNVIVNPVNHKVTHFALQDKSLPDNPTRLVPAGNVADVTQGQIELNCTKADVAKMPHFIVANFVQESGPGMAYSSGEAYTSQYVFNDTAYDEFEEPDIPEGELALYSGMKVEATDGKVGKLDELVLDPKSGEISNLLMREGHLWGKKEVTIPVSAVDFADADTVYLKLDKKDVKALPAVSVKRP
jgi:sporulation protein YlmC with PRC-barrel domain